MHIINTCSATALFVSYRISGGPDVYIVKDHTDPKKPRREDHIDLRQCYNFIKEYRLLCRHVLKITLLKGWLTTTANRDAFLEYWCAEELGVQLSHSTLVSLNMYATDLLRVIKG